MSCLKGLVGLCGWLLAGWVLLGTGRVEAAENLPNIVLILAADLGWGSLGCYGADPAMLKTPALDRLARQGRRFTDANSPSSVCSPTRYARTSLKYEVLSVYSPLHIEPQRLTLSSMLKELDYQTAVVGKWHLGYQSQRTDYTKPLRPGPQDLGFDYQFAVPSNHGDATGVYVEGEQVLGLRSATLSPGKYFNWRSRPQMGLDAPQRVDEEVMPTLTRKAVAWIEQQKADRPFFLYYAPLSAHNPVTPSTGTQGTSSCGPYGDWIHELDVSVGSVLEALDRQGLADNTLVLFTADNGGEAFGELQQQAQRAGLKPMGPFKGDKHTVWEGGFRVPYIVRWPGKVPAGTVCDEMISLTDTLATLAALLEVPLPAADMGAEDGFSVLPAWLGQKYEAPLRPYMVVHSADGNFAIRKGAWKWIEGQPTKPNPPQIRRDEFHPQLYNLASDLAETQDIQAAHPAVVAELSTLLERCRSQRQSR